MARHVEADGGYNISTTSFHCGVEEKRLDWKRIGKFFQMIGSEFGVKSRNPWIEPAMFRVVAVAGYALHS